MKKSSVFFRKLMRTKYRVQDLTCTKDSCLHPTVLDRKSVRKAALAYGTRRWNISTLQKYPSFERRDRRYWDAYQQRRLVKEVADILRGDYVSTTTITLPEATKTGQQFVVRHEGKSVLTIDGVKAPTRFPVDEGADVIVQSPNQEQNNNGGLVLNEGDSVALIADGDRWTIGSPVVRLSMEQG